MLALATHEPRLVILREGRAGLAHLTVETVHQKLCTGCERVRDMGYFLWIVLWHFAAPHVIFQSSHLYVYVIDDELLCSTTG